MSLSMKEYTIIPPTIPSGTIYFFTTDKGVQYEVRFGRKRDNILMATLVFSVLNEEYNKEEYIITNTGEVYNVMATLVRIVKMYMTEHPKVISYEITGIAKDGEDEGQATSRVKLYSRYVKTIFDASWETKSHGDKMMVYRKNKLCQEQLTEWLKTTSCHINNQLIH